MEALSKMVGRALFHFQQHALQVVLGVSSLFANAPSSGSREAACLAFRERTDLKLINTTILGVQYYGHPVESVPTLGVCLPSATIQTPLCRVQFAISTSDTSVVTAEAWLPDTWHGRFLALGNGGLSGCIDYMDLDYGTSMHFATVASNNGHEGNTGESFMNNPEVHIDFACRAIHAEAVVGKQIVEAYYGKSHSKAYFSGCSTGGRQGIDAALRYPNDFDGILSGAPATDFINIMGHVGMLAGFVGGPNASQSGNPHFISMDKWSIIAEEVLRQCDGIDGLVDGIITEPDDCEFRPEALLCEDETRCLTATQAETLRKIYSPIYGTEGNLLASRFDPGAEGGPAELRPLIFSGEIYPTIPDYWRHAIYNDTERDLSRFDVKDMEAAGAINPAGIATNGGNMSRFNSAGGKLLLFHGRHDPIIASGNTKRLYDRISRALGMASLDTFLRLFLVPGLDHCNGGPGASDLGQGGFARGQFNDTAHNIILALVDWVENGNAPDSIIGVNPESGLEREHCRYPQRSVYNGVSFECVE